MGIDQAFRSAELSLGLGCTTCDPSALDRQLDLPDDADELLDRPEYWIVYRNVFAKSATANKGQQSSSSSSSSSSHHHVSLADELCFKLDERTGNLHFYINSSLVTECLFSVDITQRLWFFFYLNGKINAIRLIPSCNSSSTPLSHQQQSGADTSISVSRRQHRPSSALIDYYKAQIMCVEDEHQVELQPAVKSTANKSVNYNQDECKVCWSAPIECVLYSCGHMCLCWNWYIKNFEFFFFFS